MSFVKVTVCGVGSWFVRAWDGGWSVVAVRSEATGFGSEGEARAFVASLGDGAVEERFLEGARFEIEG